MNLRSRIAQLEKRAAAEEAQARSRTAWAAEAKTKAESQQAFIRGWQKANVLVDKERKNEPLSPEEEASLVEAHRQGTEWIKENWGDTGIRLSARQGDPRDRGSALKS